MLFITTSLLFTSEAELSGPSENPGNLEHWQQIITPYNNRVKEGRKDNKKKTAFPSIPSFPSPLGGHISSLHATDDSLIVTMDVAQFRGPDDLKISVVGQFIVVEGKHGEKQDEFGTIERHFIRKFNLPRNVQPEGVSSKLTSDGTLTIEAIPLRPKEGSPARAIPIKIVGGAPPAPSEAKAEEAK
ncbi:unnamed protein product [Haemonchus placei]|uniref:SHSP domain-containing protein n=1 Tax=Haemonchus placei TaxID=6290 RepID=A0A0N4W386_HAEPC|nr:unnamed protein product [Haemonchus placei]